MGLKIANEDSFVKLPAYILFHQNLSIDAKIIYMALKWHCFGKQSCYPSIDLLQEECNMSIHKTKHGIKELYLNKVSGKVPEDVFDDLNSSFLSDKSAKQKELEKDQNDLSNLKEKELNSKFIKAKTLWRHK